MDATPMCNFASRERDLAEPIVIDHHPQGKTFGATPKWLLFFLCGGLFGQAAT